MTLQLLGGTFAVAVGTTAYALTGRFEPIYLVNAGLLAVVLMVIWRWMHVPAIAAPADTRPPAGDRPSGR
jgi:hypothetical protein